MRNQLLNPDRLIQRTWHAGRPLRPRLSRLRQFSMLALLIVLSVIICGYLYITDSTRVRTMASDYLSGLIGSDVQIGGADLTIFEGLKLTKVTVRVRNGFDPNPLLFSAESLLIRYDPAQLIAGKIAAQQIVVVNPLVRLSEDAGTHQWNYQSLTARPGPKTAAPSGGPAIPLPEVLLRNGRVDYSEVRGGVSTPRASIGLEGQVVPVSGTELSFRLQSRGGDVAGPFARGMIETDTGAVTAELYNFNFDGNLQAMLPPVVRLWWEQHDLQGQLDIPHLFYQPGSGNRPAKFNIETNLNRVTLAFSPQELSSTRERERNVAAVMMLQNMREHGIDPGNTVSTLISDGNPEPIRLDQCSGTFIFTDDHGIVIRDVAGRIEDSPLEVWGVIGGYSPDAPLDLTVSTGRVANMYVPASPRYLTSLPPQVRNIYELLHPEGSFSGWFRLKRDVAGEKPAMSGDFTLVDVNVQSALCPYPIRHCKGEVVIKRDPVLGFDTLRMVNVHANGAAGGVNQNSEVLANGWIGPLDPTAGGHVNVSAGNWVSEPLLLNSLPPDIRKSIGLFDPHHDGTMPKFTASFLCDITRPVGLGLNWDVSSNIHIYDCDAALCDFPYPLKHLAGEIDVKPDFLRCKLHSASGDQSLDIVGVITLPPKPKDTRGNPVKYEVPRTPRPNINIWARNIPIDQTLLNALPQKHRGQIAQLGIGGKMDVEGSVFSDLDFPNGPPDFAAPASQSASGASSVNGASQVSVSPPAPAASPASPATTTSSASPVVALGDSHVSYAFNIHVHDGSVWPTDGVFALQKMTADVRATPGRLQVLDAHATRGAADITASGSVTFEPLPQRMAVVGAAKNLALDDALHHIVPDAGKKAWDIISPHGAVDATLDFDSDRPDMLVTLWPRGISVKAAPFPYALTNVKGKISIDGPAVTLSNISATHGPTHIAMAGAGTLGQDLFVASRWDVQLAASNLKIDDDLINALPASEAALAKSLALRGTMAIQFPKLVFSEPATPQKADPAPNAITPDAAADAASTQTDPSTQNNASTQTAAATNPSQATASAPGPDVDFILQASPSALDLQAGVPITDFVGEIDLTGAIRNGAVTDLSGQINADSMKIAGRGASDLEATVSKPHDLAALQISKIQGDFCGGSLAGEVDMVFPENQSGRYGLNMELRSADVRTLTGETDPKMNGQMSASLALEGVYDQPQSRRGRGDVNISGNNMYRLPVVVGLLQIANLTLPLSSPYASASANYSVDGQHIGMDEIVLRGQNMTMTGNGTLDFDTNKVSMTFLTSNPDWLKLPLLGDLIQQAHDEILKIRVNGTLQNLHVSASPFDTVTSTIDQVLSGNQPQ